MNSDAEVRRAETNQVTQDPDLGDDDTAVTGSHGAATLSGHVGSGATMRKAETIVSHVRGVAGVVNHLQADNPQPTDTDLVQTVLAAIAASGADPDHTVKPVVRDGWLLLGGEVAHASQKRMIEHTVRHLPDIHGYSNNIVVESEGLSIRTSHRIAEVFTRNAQLNAQRVVVTVHDHRVVLTGAVSSRAEREAAEDAARSVEGVAAVINRIRTN